MSTKQSLFLLYLISFSIFSQEQEFLKVAQHYINGEAAIIGNNIMSAHESKPFNDFSLLNDQVRMTYVDIDNEGSTFSSSSASLEVPHENAKVLKATLYWSAVYPFAKGSKREKPTEIIYYGSGEREENMNIIKFKIPGSDYQIVKGTMIFDGFEQEEFADSAPYVCYADVTDLLSSNDDFSGEYTAANIRASLGYVSGGSAAGWFLFIVYEAEEATAKYITSYHGFASINDNSVDLKFSDFKTKEEGKIEASIYAATLEGDAKLYRDQCEIKNYKDSTYIPLSNSLRPAKNFFNSKISINKNYFTARNPNSSNTLGFDLLQIKAPSNLLTNNQTETTLRLGTRADRFYLFFTAFSIEINEIFQLSKEAITEEEIRGEDVMESDAEDVIEADPKEAIVNSENEAKPMQDVNEKPKANKTEPKTSEGKVSDTDSIPDNSTLSIREMEKRLRKVNMTNPSLQKGYYLITNVFSKPSYAKRWEDFLVTKGYSPGTIINPKNNWHYVYVYMNQDLYSVYKTYQKLVKLDYFNEIWVFKINMK